MRVSELVSIEADHRLPVLTVHNGTHLSTSPSSSLDVFYLSCWKGKTTIWGDLVRFATGMKTGQGLEIELKIFKELVTRDFTIDVTDKAVLIKPLVDTT